MKTIVIRGKSKAKPCLPLEAVETLRRKGGAHGRPGYNRKKEKERWRKEK